MISIKNKILDNLISLIKTNTNYNDIKLMEIRYGLESLYLTIFKMIIIFILSFLLNDTKELILFLLSYGLLRLVCFGAHAKRSIDCWIYSLLFFTLIPYSIKYIDIPKNILLIVSIICFLLLIIYAPADTEKRPLINKKKRTIYKIITIILSLIYLLSIIFNNNLYLLKILTFSLLLESILVIPITYKILGVKYNNYRSYKGKEDKK